MTVLGGGGGIQATPTRGKSLGPTYLLAPPKTKAGPSVCLGCKLRGLMCLARPVSGPCSTDYRSRTRRNESGPYWAKQGPTGRSPWDGSGSRWTNPRPAGQTRAPQDELGPRSWASKAEKGSPSRDISGGCSPEVMIFIFFLETY